jgi:hypothetical protein
MRGVTLHIQCPLFGPVVENLRAVNAYNLHFLHKL